MKLSLSGGAIKSFALHHGEKIGVALVGVFVLMLVYKTLGIDKLDADAPDNLESLAGNAQDTITRTNYTNPAGDDSSTFPTMKPVDHEHWQWNVALNPDLWPPSAQREDPQLFSAEQLEVSSDFGPLAKIDPRASRGRPTTPRDNIAAIIEQQQEANKEVRVVRGISSQRGVQPSRGDRLEGAAWVVVNALVPLQKQRAEYDRVFQNAEHRDPSKDAPRYIAYLVQRADVTEGGEPNWSKSKTIQKSTIQKLVATYSGQALEVADPSHLDPELLSEPLPPLVGRDFGPQVVHSEIPRELTRDQLLLQQEEEARTLADETDEDEAAEGSESEDGLDDLREDALDLSAGRRGEEEFGRRDERGRGRRARVAHGRPGERMPNPRVGRPTSERRQGGSTYARVPYLLLRYFDFETEPGRRYQYRVRLVVGDPNHQVPPRYLAAEVADRRAKLDKKKRFFRLTDWSEPSPPIAVPYAGRLVAGPATAPSSQRLNGEPKISTLVKTFDEDRDAAAAAELADYYRGTVGNITTSIDILKLIDGELEEVEDYRFTTESSILDIRGGKKLSANNNEDLTAPGHMLVLTRSGKLVIQSELKDKMEYDEYRDVFSKEESREPKGREREEPGKDGRPGRGGGNPLFRR